MYSRPDEPDGFIGGDRQRRMPRRYRKRPAVRYLSNYRDVSTEIAKSDLRFRRCAVAWNPRPLKMQRAADSYQQYENVLIARTRPMPRICAITPRSASGSHVGGSYCWRTTFCDDERFKECVFI